MVTDQGSAAACKISREGSTLFAMSGLVHDRAAGLDVAALARGVAKGSFDIPEKVDRFVADVQPGLQSAVNNLKRDSLADYDYLRAGHPVLQAIFADLQGGAPVMAMVGFNLTPDGALSPQKTVVASGSPRLIYAGQQGRIREYLRSHRDWFARANDGFIKDLVQLEVDANSGLVGGPVDLVALDANGPRWLQKKPECGR